MFWHSIYQENASGLALDFEEERPRAYITDWRIADIDSVETEATAAAEAVPFAADEGLVTENEEEASVCTPASDGQWVTFVNKSSGATFSVPAHTQVEKEDRWRGPGVWTSEDDLLDDKALEIITSIKNKPRSSKGRGILAFHVQQHDQRKLMPPIDISKRLVEPYVAPSWTNDVSSHQMIFSSPLTHTKTT